MPRKSTEHGRTAVWPEMTVTFFVSTLNRGSSPETENTTALSNNQSNKQTINTTDNRHFYKCLLTHSSWGRTLHPRDSSKYCLHLSTLSNFVYTQLWIIALRIGIITLLWRRTRGRRSCRMILNFLDSTFVRRQTEKTPE